jgi:5,10-methylenetetrahydrofolate reductase
MARKAGHGAVGIITQPVYDIENAEMLIELMAEANAAHGSETQLILGVFPITKLRTARFLDRHVPGIHVPPDWIERLERSDALGAEEAYKVGFELSKQLFDDIMRLHPKVHLMTANQFGIAKALLA